MKQRSLFLWRQRRRALSALTLLASMIVFQQNALAFCGFYVSGSNDDLYADATQVALMRGGTMTILSMENNYRGPLEDFAMVVPVPRVVMQDQVKTLDPGLFRRLDKLTAPRLVQYWEKDPCEDNLAFRSGGDCSANATTPANNLTGSGNYESPPFDPSPNNVTIEAEFVVGEYEIVVLSSAEATTLEDWLVENEYNIPAGATEVFEQYIQQGMYFFVAKIDPAKVTFEDGRAILSPLRFHYTSETFSLPIRLGMINSAGSQDLIVYTIGGNQRYELGNYPNALIPTNINVKAQVKEDFPAYYEKLFSRTLAENPGAVITEYAWSASGCDPCPVPPMDGQDLATLGADVLIETGKDTSRQGLPSRDCTRVMGSRISMRTWCLPRGLLSVEARVARAESNRESSRAVSIRSRGATSSTTALKARRIVSTPCEGVGRRHRPRRRAASGSRRVQIPRASWCRMGSRRCRSRSSRMERFPRQALRS